MSRLPIRDDNSRKILDSHPTANVAVTNTGKVAGDEVVQVYIRDEEASITRPVLELKAFHRVTLKPGETGTIRFEIPVGQLALYDRNLDYVVEDGDIEILVGTSSSIWSPPVT